MKILVCGGRDYCDKKKMFNYLDTLHQQYTITNVVNGGYTGADALACLWADCNDVPKSVHKADWDTHGSNAGPIRNQLMLDLHPDIAYVIAFPGNDGTQDMVDRAIENGKTVIDINKVLKFF